MAKIVLLIVVPLRRPGPLGGRCRPFYPATGEPIRVGEGLRQDYQAA